MSINFYVLCFYILLSNLILYLMLYSKVILHDMLYIQYYIYIILNITLLIILISIDYSWSLLNILKLFKTFYLNKLI